MENLPNDWDAIQKGLNASVLQSRDWADVQESMGRKAHFEWSNHWSWVGFERKAKGIRYLLVPYGPTAALKADESLESLVNYARNHGFDFVRLEPRGNFTDNDLQKVEARQVAELDPEYTQVVDLTKSEEELRSELNSGHRNLINGTKRRGLIIEQRNAQKDIDLFSDMLADTAKRAKVSFYPREYYQTIWKIMAPRGTAKLYFANHNGESIASALFYDYNGTRYYAHAGAFQEINRKVKGSVSLLWQAIVDAKAMGAISMDLWGVAPNDDPKHKWAGISSFKKGYGGTTVQYAGTYDIPLNKTKYKLYRTLSKLRGRQ